jgi:hypothetical protein
MRIMGTSILLRSAKPYHRAKVQSFGEKQPERVGSFSSTAYRSTEARRQEAKISGSKWRWSQPENGFGIGFGGGSVSQFQPSPRNQLTQAIPSPLDFGAPAPDFDLGSDLESAALISSRWIPARRRIVGTRLRSIRTN